MRTGAIWTILAILTANSASAMTSTRLLRIHVSDGSGDCDFIVRTEDGRKLIGIDFNCDGSKPLPFSLEQAMGPKGVVLKSANLLFGSCDVVRLKVTDTDRLNQVKGILTYKTSCLSGSTAQFDFGAAWNGSSQWQTQVDAEPAYCFDVKVGATGVQNITPDSRPDCVH